MLMPGKCISSAAAGSHSSSYRSTRPYFGNRVFAIVIGVDEYTNIRGVNLRGAVADATAFGQFLQYSFTDPTITYLYNKEATRSSILAALSSLHTDQRIQRNDAMVIYFAGHGTRCAKPDSPDWSFWSSPDSKIELLCPSDVQDPRHTDRKDVICGIPDRTIAALLDRTAKEKGNNIVSITACSLMLLFSRTFILDRHSGLLPFCGCHAGSRIGCIAKALSERGCAFLYSSGL